MRQLSGSLIVFVAAQLAAQNRSGAFIRLRGADTISIERFTLTPDSLVGDIAQGRRMGGYRIALSPDHWAMSLDFTTGGFPVRGGQLRISESRIEGALDKGGQSPIDVSTRSRAMPTLLPSIAQIEQTLRTMRPADKGPQRIPIFRPDASGIVVDTLVASRLSADSVLVQLSEGDLRLAVARDGRILGGSGFGPDDWIYSGAAPAAWPPPAKPSQPAPASSVHIISPEVHPDRTLTLRLRAPAAHVVNVLSSFDGFMFTRRMSRDSTGVWTITLGPLAARVYSYQFIIDGIATTDPLNESSTGQRSLVEIPDSSMPWSVRDVPHGTVSTIWYHSRALGGAFRGVTVYTPPGYESSTSLYPVLYMLHGLGGTESTWTEEIRGNLIADNLIADQRMKPMIVVAPFGEARPSTKLGNLAANQRSNGGSFPIDDLLQDVIPLIEQRYRVVRDADGRAIAGGSQGGADVLIELGLGHPELFHWVGAFSAGMGVAAAQRAAAAIDPAVINRELRLLWTSCGRADSFLSANEAFSTALDTRGVRHRFVVFDGYHVDTMNPFPQFAALLFR